jgi:hypothetical protein
VSIPIAKSSVDERAAFLHSDSFKQLPINFAAFNRCLNFVNLFFDFCALDFDGKKWMENFVSVSVPNQRTSFCV